MGDEARAANQLLAQLKESGVAPDGVQVTLTPTGKTTVGIAGLNVTHDDIGAAMQAFTDRVDALPESQKPDPAALTTRTVYDYDTGEFVDPEF